MSSDTQNHLFAARHSAALDRFFVLGPFVALGLVLLLLWTMVAWFALRYSEDLIQDAERELLNAASAVAQETDAVFRDAESSLRTLDLMLLTRGTAGATSDAAVAMLTDSLRDAKRGLVDVMLGDADGQLYRIPLYGNAAHATLPEADFVKKVNADHASAVLVGSIMQLRPGGKDLIPVALKLSAPIGKLTMAVAMLDVDSLRNALQPRLSRHQGLIALLRNDGLGILRVPHAEAFIGQRFGTRELWDQIDANETGILQVPGNQFIDRQERITAFSHLSHAKLIFIVSQGLASTLATYHQERLFMIGVAALISAVALLMTWLLARLQREAQLREAALRATSDASPLGLFRCDADGRMIYANETYLTLHGIRREELAWGWLTLIPPEQRAELKQRWIDQVHAGTPIDTVLRLRRRDGTAPLVSLRTAPLLVNGRPVGQAGAIEDITERVAQQEAVRTLGAILDMTPDYVCQIDRAGKLLYLNPAARRRLGLAPDADPGALNYEQFFDAPQMERFRQEIQPMAQAAGHWHGRSVARLGPGDEVPVDITVLVHTGEHRSIETTSMILRDVSVEVQAARNLQRSQAMLSAIAQASPAMISVLNREHRYVFVNHAFEAEFGLRHDECLGRHIGELLGDDNCAQSQAAVDRALRGETVQLEKTYSARGAPLIVEMQYAPLRNDADEIDGVICIGYDITESREKELRLRNASQTDALTGLLNRSGFAQRAAEQIALAHQHNHLIAVLYLDLDRFKPVNDEHGHAVGDSLLIAVAGRLRRALRPQDLLARLGGDEFAVLLPNLQNGSDAAKVADKLVRVLGTPFMVDHLNLHVGVSIGFSVRRGQGAELDAMVRQADAKLYEAKRAGRDCFRGSVA